MHGPHRIRKRALVASVVAACAMALAACAPTASAPTTTAVGTRTVSNATFEWTISREADGGSQAPGQVNYWSAGQSDSTAATYVATNGNATVLKKNASGTYVPIGSESAVSWANKNKDGAGNTVTATANALGQKIRYTNGTGTVNTTTGAATIQWTGTFTINFYGTYVPFWIVNPKLTVTAGGAGKLTATVGGYASSQDDPTVRTPLAPVANVVVAEFANVWGGGAASTGFTSATKYVGTAVTAPATAPQVAKTTANQAYWGAWPQSFVNFQNSTGLGSYWYTSGGTADSRKPQNPVSVAYTLNP